MPRMKKTQKRSREGESSVEPPPSNHPLAKWFHANEDLIFYELQLPGRKEIPPRYLDPNLLVSQNFSHLSEILTMQGLMDFLQFRDKYYPELTSIAYATLGIESNTQDPKDFSMMFKLGKDTYRIKCDRTLLYLVTYVLEPRVSGHGNVADEDLVLMWAMVNEIKINWPYLILHHMLRLKGKDTSGGIGYLCLWTRIFNHLGIDVSNENVKHLTPRSVINEATLHHMGRGKGVQEEEQAPQMAFRGHPGPSSSSHEEPTMSDLMQVLQSIEQNMDQRFQRIEDNQTRMDRRLQRMERHMRIQEDEDKDQE
ncbi:hypothetical protein PIB30_074858 [Stylosanthes scabra]|uniref:Uncharacterized protein n=1 Tax=Stylosanthes scabra TaxID=79078 RepID=A0ABU6WRE1_9FABA|nr:hypothetical protein [Stylosanthes scabra]